MDRSSTRTEQNPTVRVLEAAARQSLHAPSVFNTQPWRWRVTADALELRTDPGRQLAHPATSANAGPRQSANASANRAAARSIRSDSSAASRRRASARRLSKRSASSTSGRRSSRYADPAPTPVVTRIGGCCGSVAWASARRRCETWLRRVIRAAAGAGSPQSSSTSRSAGTVDPASTSSTASSSTSFGPSLTGRRSRSTRIGPSTLIRSTPRPRSAPARASPDPDNYIGVGECSWCAARW